MAKQTINVGSSANDGTGDKIRVAFQKCNSNFDELYDAVDPVNLISTDADNSIVLGTDNKLWSGGGGGSVGTLQQVTDNGNTTTNDITAGSFLSLGNANIPAINFNDAGDLDTSLGVLGADPSITTPRNWGLPNASGTIALTSDIPPSITIDATPTDGSSNAVSSNGVFDALTNKVDKNTAITGATKTKITYDSKGLVTSGADATTADVADSTNKRYVTDAQLVVIGNTSGTNTGDNATNSQYSGLATSKQDVLTETNFGAFMNARTAKNTLVDADEVVSDDSADSNKAKKTTWLNVWTNYLKPKADSLYQAILTYVPIKSIVADYTNSSGVTGTASETLISSYKINANTLSALDFMNMTLRLLKTGTTAGYLIRIRIGTTSTFSTSLTQIAQNGNTLSTALDVNFQRYFKIEGGLLKGSNFTNNSLFNQGASFNVAENTTSFNVAVDNWIFVSIQPQSNNADVITQSIFKITN